MRFNLTHEQFARDWALGQFNFHVMAAYAILRKEGVEIGKADYVPHMFGYLRAGLARDIPRQGYWICLRARIVMPTRNNVPHLGHASSVAGRLS